jgi:hypothetical protein
MPSARPSSFSSGGGGMLRKVDGTIVGLEFIQKDFDAVGAKAANAKTGQAAQLARAASSKLQAQLTILVDGADEPVQPFAIGVGSVDDYTFEGATITGEKPLSKSSGWYLFLQSVVDAQFPEDAFPDDPLTADYSALIGGRFKFDWLVNEKLTTKYGKKLSKKINPKTNKPYENDREDLIVTAYYGQADVAPAPAASKKIGVKPIAKSGVKRSAPKAAVDIAALASDKVILAVNAAKDQILSKTKLSVKILGLLAGQDADVMQEAREWAFVDANLSGIDGVDYNVETQTLTLSD